MNVPVLSAHQLVRLADNNALSLALRQKWQMDKKGENGGDPYNGLRTVVRNSKLKTFAFVFIFGSLLTDLTLLYFGFNLRDWIGLATPFPGVIWGFVWVTPGVVSFLYSVDTEGRRRVADEFRRQFSEVMYYFSTSVSKPTATKEDLEQTAKDLAATDFPELRKHAKDMMITEALRVIQHKPSNPNLEDVEWCIKHADLANKFRVKYKALAALDLVYGGYDHFYAEARKILDVESDSAAA